MKDFSIIVAMDKNRGIGNGGGLAWHISADMKYFKRITTDAPKGKVNAVVMGRKTWDSIPDRFRPLPDRVSVVLTRNAGLVLPEDHCIRAKELNEAMLILERRADIADIFIIGGASVYAQAIGLPNCRKLYITQIEKRFDCDTFFPELPQYFREMSRSERFHEKNFYFSFVQYQRFI